MIILKKKHKILFSASIFLNIVLIIFVILSVIRMNNMTERTLKTNVIDKLFELHETISKQENDDWSDLAFISKELEEAGLDTMHALNIGITSKTINSDDSEMLLKLSDYLIRYSFISNTDISAETLEEMKLNLIRFNAIITEIGFDNEEAFDSWDTKSYLKKLRTIVSEIEKAEGDNL